MNWVKVFEDHCEEIRNQRQFEIRPVMYKGELFDSFGGDSCVLNLLNYKGTGNSISFEMVQLEYAKYSSGWWDELFATDQLSKVQRLKWLDEFVMERNYQIIFADGDIVMRKGKGELAS